MTFALGQITPGFNSYTKVLSKNLPAGSWAVVATAVISVNLGGFGGGTSTISTDCQLREGANVIGGASDRRSVPGDQSNVASLSMNGGAQVPPGGEVSLWCQSQDNTQAGSAQMMMLQVGGFS